MKRTVFSRLAVCFGTLALAITSGAVAEEAGVVRISGRAKAEEVVRITSRDHETVIRGQSPELMAGPYIQPVNCLESGTPAIGTAPCDSATTAGPACETDCPEYGPQPCQPCQSCPSSGCCISGWLHEQWANIMCNHYENRAQISHKLCTSHCRLKFEHYKNLTLGRVNGRDGSEGADRLARPKESRWIRYFLPSGSCGKGSPPFGHYDMVYPVDPNYFDQRDGQIYAAQGYGGPVSMPLPPVVTHAYNYSWGIPSSRLTHIAHPVPYGMGSYGPYANGYAANGYDMNGYSQP
ncbi:MAG: hypothetical protein R3C01_14835 [Planctomycetaceae bacterium]